LGRVGGHVDGAYRDELIERFDFDPSRKVHAYSKGNRQKLSLSAAMMCRPDLVMLDEPTSGLDPLMEQVFRRCVFDAKAAGQTVFLSSHILSEVEALCDRVAILRSGHLIEAGTLAEMRHLSALSVEATFDTAAPDVSRVPGVTAVEVEGNRLRCQVHGPVEPFLQRLAAVGVTQLLSREPSLEELFLAHYGAESSPTTDEESGVGRSPSPSWSSSAGWPAPRAAAGSCGAPCSGWWWRRRPSGSFPRTRRLTSGVRPPPRSGPTRGCRHSSASPTASTPSPAGPPWRSLGLVSLIGAVWALLSATKQLRGEEDAGRWELLLAGQTTRRHAAAQAIAGLLVGLSVLWVVTAVITAAVGRRSDTAFSIRAALFLSVALASSPLMFLAVGALTSQLAATGRQAAGMAAAVLGAAFVLRLAADSGTGLTWARWLSPLGWIDELRPLTGTRPVALAPILAFTIVVAALAVYLAGRRDLGASVVPDRSTARPRTRLLGTPLGLAVRLK
jgi:hypothetical protein